MKRALMVVESERSRSVVKEDQMRERLRTANVYKALWDNMFQLLQAEENPSRTKLELQRLGEKALELVCHNSAEVQQEVNNGQR